MKCVIVIALIMMGCRPVGMFIVGIKKPKVENAETIRCFLRHTDIQSGKHVIASYNGYYNLFGELGLTTIHVFDKEGKSVNVGDHPENTCGPDPAPIIRNMNRNYVLSSDSLVLDSITARLLLPDGTRFEYRRPDSVDFVAVITWVKWIGKRILKRDVTSVLHALTENKQVTFDLIMVNLDLQELWGAENLSKVKLTKTAVEFKQ